MNPVTAYLKGMAEKRSFRGGDPETTYYGILERLLDEIGKSLKPKVHCLISLENRGGGKPDGGLYTANQRQRGADAERVKGQLPERGAIEVKPPSDSVDIVADTKQVKKYFARYGLVLVTNYRDFLLLGRDSQGNPLPMEAFTLAGTEKAFWHAAAHPQETVKEYGERFCEYVKRVMLSNAPLSMPQDVAWFLASYARDALVRVEQKKQLPALTAVRGALEEALGMKFTDEKGEHFFRSTLVQTIFYGVFSAWVLWHRQRPDRQDDFNWREAEWTLHVPFIRTLYEQVATASKLGPLGLVEVLDWTAGALNRVDREAFFQKFRDEHAVEYFYEPFLKSFDPKLQKELGVWYTPREIVRYQVARVDAVLRDPDGLNIADGLADPNVIVLDPCCGTGAYLVEVLKCIAQTLKAKDGDALIASDLKKAAMTRIFGFEIMPAPFVASHLQLGLMLRDLGAPLLAKANDRVGVYLTNALTGWQPPQGPKQHILPMPELEQERDAADAVKRDARVLVVLGNPPYNAFAGISPEEEQGLVEPYKGIYYTEKKGKSGQVKRLAHYTLNDPVSAGGWGIKKFNLDDLYIRFFRLAERRIAEMSGRGVVSFISNFSYLNKRSFVVMRQRFLGEFDRLWFDCMNGDSRETGKLTPEGKPDPSVFSTEYNRQGIRVGTAVCLMVRKEKRDNKPIVRFRHFWGVTKRQDLLAGLPAKDAAYTPAKPSKENRYSFRPEKVSAEYNGWPKTQDLAEADAITGYKENRGFCLIDGDKAALKARMQLYYDRSCSWDELAYLGTGLTKDAARFNAKSARKKVLAVEEFDQSRVKRYILRPFALRWCYYCPIRPLWNEPRPSLYAHHFKGNGYLVTRPNGVASPEGVPFFFTNALGDFDFIRGHSYHFPVLLAPTGEAKGGQTGKMFKPEPKANLSPAARAYLAALGIKDPDAGADVAGLVWLHVLGIGYSPLYLVENADGIRRDWPRVPLPDSRKALEKSAELGGQVAALLNTEAEVSGVTAGHIEPFLRTVGVPSKVGGGGLDVDAGDLAIEAGWGYGGKGGTTMPGKGQIVQRPYGPHELQAIAEAAKTRGIPQKQALDLLGHDTRDVYLNDKAYWKNIPASVWDYYIGGYQVIKKWLSYREEKLLGRALTTDEGREVMNMARRLAAIVLMQPALDKNYKAAKAHVTALASLANSR